MNDLNMVWINFHCFCLCHSLPFLPLSRLQVLKVNNYIKYNECLLWDYTHKKRRRLLIGHTLWKEKECINCVIKPLKFTSSHCLSGLLISSGSLWTLSSSYNLFWSSPGSLWISSSDKGSSESLGLMWH